MLTFPQKSKIQILLIRIGTIVYQNFIVKMIFYKSLHRFLSHFFCIQDLSRFYAFFFRSDLPVYSVIYEDMFAINLVIVQ